MEISKCDKVYILLINIWKSTKTERTHITFYVCRSGAGLGKIERKKEWDLYPFCLPGFLLSFGSYLGTYVGIRIMKYVNVYMYHSVLFFFLLQPNQFLQTIVQFFYIGFGYFFLSFALFFFYDDCQLPIFIPYNIYFSHLYYKCLIGDTFFYFSYSYSHLGNGDGDGNGNGWNHFNELTREWWFDMAFAIITNGLFTCFCNRKTCIENLTIAKTLGSNTRILDTYYTRVLWHIHIF